MRNNEYKKAFNQLNVSYKTIDNLYDITAQSKHKAITLPKKIIATVMAFVLVVGGGFGISYSVSDKASMGIYSKRERGCKYKKSNAARFYLSNLYFRKQ